MKTLSTLGLGLAGFIFATGSYASNNLSGSSSQPTLAPSSTQEPPAQTAGKGSTNNGAAQTSAGHPTTEHPSHRATPENHAAP